MGVASAPPRQELMIDGLMSCITLRYGIPCNFKGLRPWLLFVFDESKIYSNLGHHTLTGNGGTNISRKPFVLWMQQYYYSNNLENFRMVTLQLHHGWDWYVESGHRAIEILWYYDHDTSTWTQYTKCPDSPRRWPRYSTTVLSQIQYHNRVIV